MSRVFDISSLPTLCGILLAARACALQPGTTLQGRAAEVWVFGGLNSSDVNCMMDDFWHASVTFNSSTGNFTLHWEEVKVPSTSNRPSARGIAQSWLQYEHVNDFTDGNWVHFEKTTLCVESRTDWLGCSYCLAIDAPRRQGNTLSVSHAYRLLDCFVL